MADELVIAGRAFKSRLIVGTGKYRSFQEMARAHAASGADMVTVAVRRVNLTDKSKESLLDYIDREKIFILPNTAACYTADEAIRTARLAREVGLSNWVKLEVIGDQQTLFPDTEQLIEATRVLVKEASSFSLTPTTTSSPPASSLTPAPPPSCLWPRPSAPAWECRIPPTSASSANASPKFHDRGCRRRHRL